MSASTSKTKPTSNQREVVSADADLFDDDMLLQAYETAIGMEQAKIAQYLANETNKKDTTPTEEEASELESSDDEYKVGDIIRATFDEDGIDYEAKIIDINGSHCEVKFLGYGNEQTVAVKDLVDSWGVDAQNKQRAAAAKSGDAESDTERPVRNPQFSSVRNARGSKQGSMPIPPMPPMPPKPPMLHGMSPAESDHFSAMLMSWYMSGYYTGIYQGFRMAQTEPSQDKKNTPSTSKRK